MSRPIPIAPHCEPAVVDKLQGSSPLGTSPPFAHSPTTFQHDTAGKDSVVYAAKKFWARILYDDTLDPSEFVVGFVGTYQSGQRKSGAEAWSMRVHHIIEDIPFMDFRARFEDEDVPYHRIAYFKRGDTIAWDAKAQKRGPGSQIKKGDSPQASSLPDAGSPSPTIAQQLCPPESTSSPHPADLPHECWQHILMHLGVRDLCMAARVNSTLRELASSRAAWGSAYKALFGRAPDECMTTPAIKRVCRRSELKAAQWLEVPVARREAGFMNTSCLAMDSSKVVSGDGSAVRLWSHTTGRRISTLQGHSSGVLSVAFDEEYIMSGCCAGVVHVWAMDELKGRPPLRGHTAPVTAAALRSGIPISGSEDGQVRFWSPIQGSSVALIDVGVPVHSLTVDTCSHHLVSGGWRLELWDMSTLQRITEISSPLDETHAIFGGDTALQPFTSVSVSGALLAASTASYCSLWDVRSGEPVASLYASYSCSSPAILAGVQLDDWKMVVAVEDAVEVYDLRRVYSDGHLRQPVLSLQCPHTITAVKFHDNTLLTATSDGGECWMWQFGNTESASSVVADVACGSPEDAEKKADKDKRKKNKQHKKQTRYPKRTTR